MSGSTRYSVWNGMSADQLQATLATFQAALIDLLSQDKPVTVSYGQADGTKTVTYTRTSEQALRNAIGEVQHALGNRSARRRAIGVAFG